MNGFKPNCIDDFLISNSEDRRKIELILSRQLPFPFGGKSGILFHGTWGTGKSTLATLLPELIEMSFSGEWDLSKGVGYHFTFYLTEQGANRNKDKKRPKEAFIHVYFS